jgi:hypothetical protein
VVALETVCWFESSLGHKERKRKRAVSAADSFSFFVSSPIEVVAVKTACWFPACVTQSGRESSLGHKERKRKRAVSAVDSFSFFVSFSFLF